MITLVGVQVSGCSEVKEKPKVVRLGGVVIFGDENSRDGAGSPNECTDCLKFHNGKVWVECQVQCWSQERDETQVLRAGYRLNDGIRRNILCQSVLAQDPARLEDSPDHFTEEPKCGKDSVPKRVRDHVEVSAWACRITNAWDTGSVAMETGTYVATSSGFLCVKRR